MIVRRRSGESRAAFGARDRANLYAKEAMKRLGSQEAHDATLEGICTYLRLVAKIPCSKINQRPVETSKGWRCPGAIKGFPDLVGVIPPHGRVLLVEVKSGGAVLRPDQRDVGDEWAKAGALFVVARSVDDVINALDPGD